MTMPDENTGRLHHDPQEDDPELRPLIDAAEQEAEAQLLAEGHGLSLGFCHLLWPLQQTILREKHGIHWQTPAEMNPDVIFD